MIIGGNSFMEISENEFLHGVSSYSATLATLANVTHRCIVCVNVVESITSEVTKQHARFLCENAIAVTMRESSAKIFIRFRNMWK